RPSSTSPGAPTASSGASVPSTATSSSSPTDTPCACSPLGGSGCRLRSAAISRWGQPRSRGSAGSATRPSSRPGTRPATPADRRLDRKRSRSPPWRRYGPQRPCNGPESAPGGRFVDTDEEAMMGSEIMGPAGQIHVDDDGSGDGVPVVFIHSFAGSGQHWANQLDHLRPGRRAIALDLRGHGQSEAKADDDISIDDLAADVGTVVESLDLPRVALVGHSI